MSLDVSHISRASRTIPKCVNSTTSSRKLDCRELKVASTSTQNIATAKEKVDEDGIFSKALCARNISKHGGECSLRTMRLCYNDE